MSLRSCSNRNNPSPANYTVTSPVKNPDFESPVEEIEHAINHSPLEPNSCGDVTVTAQTNGVETLGNDIKAPVHEPTSGERKAIVAQINGLEMNEENIIASILKNGDEGGGGDDSSQKDHEKLMCIDDEDPEEIMYNDENDEDDIEQEHPPDMVSGTVVSNRKRTNLEIFVGELDKSTMEEDLEDIFGKFGEIKSSRIIRNRATSKSKGFAFIQYASYDQVESAISASEVGIKVNGKQVKVSLSNDKSLSNDTNTTLYLGNICRSWTEEHVLETLKNMGIENVEEVRLPAAQKGGRTRGFAFLEFDTHSDAISAFERLNKPDAIFGRDGSVKVSFSQTSLHPHEEEVIPLVKTIYVKGLTDVWTKEKIKEFCQQYGEVEEIRLSRTVGKKRKDYGHIDFTTRESALACLEGFNKSCIEENSTVKASIAKPLLKDRSKKKVRRGGSKVEKEGEVSTIEERENRDLTSNLNSRANSRRSKGKSKSSDNNLSVSKHHLAQDSTKLEKAKGKGNNLHMMTESRGPSKMNRGPRRKTSEKSQGKNQGNQNTRSGKRRRDNHGSKGSNRSVDFGTNHSVDFGTNHSVDFGTNHSVDFGTYRSHYATGHAVPVRYEDLSYNTNAGSKRPYADMEPHAGYLEPVARKQGRAHDQYEPLVPVHYSPHARAIYQPREVGTYHQARVNYQTPPVQVRYGDPALITQPKPHSGYYQHDIGNSGHDLRGLIVERGDREDHSSLVYRGGREDLHKFTPFAYRAAPSVPPSYPQHYTSRDGYEAGSSGGAYYQRSGVQQPHRGTYL